MRLFFSVVQTIFNIFRCGEGGQNIFSIFRGVQKNSRNLGGGGKSFIFREGYEEIDKKMPGKYSQGVVNQICAGF